MNYEGPAPDMSDVGTLPFYPVLFFIIPGFFPPGGCGAAPGSLVAVTPSYS